MFEFNTFFDDEKISDTLADELTSKSSWTSFDFNVACVLIENYVFDFHSAFVLRFVNELKKGGVYGFNF